MRIFKRVLGGLLLATPFVVLVFIQAQSQGWMAAGITWALVATTLALIVAGVQLIDA